MLVILRALSPSGVSISEYPTQWSQKRVKFTKKELSSQKQSQVHKKRVEFTHKNWALQQLSLFCLHWFVMFTDGVRQSKFECQKTQHVQCRTAMCRSRLDCLWKINDYKNYSYMRFWEETHIVQNVFHN